MVVTNVSNNPGGDLSPSWSPDGSRLAWGRAMGSGTRGWVVVANADGSAQVQLDEPADWRRQRGRLTEPASTAT